MIKIVIMLVCVAGAGALGFFGERFMRPTAAPGPSEMMAQKKPELLFKLPLGKFTMQSRQRVRTLHLIFDVDVYVMGAAAFQNINGAVGRARLRDATVTAIAEIIETDQSLADEVSEDDRKRAIAEQIVRRLYVDFPTIRTARLNNYRANFTIDN